MRDAEDENTGSRMTSYQKSLAERHCGLAIRIADRMSEHIVGFGDEARSAALFGLCQAALAFDPGRGLGFLTFARRRIAGSVRDAMRSNGILGYRRRMRGHSSGECPRVFSLFSPSKWVDEAGVPVERWETIPDSAEPPDDSISSEDTIHYLLSLLPPRQREVMTCLYTRADCRTMESAGRVLEVSLSAVSFHHTDAIQMIRSSLGISGSIMGAGR